jgi:hypothetical protein
MKKRNEKELILEYLRKTKKHLFLKPKREFNYQTGNWEFDWDSPIYFRIVKKGDEYFTIEGDKIRPINVDQIIKNFGKNSPKITKDSLFRGTGMKAVRQNKYHIEKHNDLIPQEYRIDLIYKFHTL